MPGRSPSSTSAFFIHEYRRRTEIPKSFAIWSSPTPGSRFAGDPDDVVAELLGIGLGHGGHPSSAPSDQQIRCHLSVQQTRVMVRLSSEVLSPFAVESIAKQLQIEVNVPR